MKIVKYLSIILLALLIIAGISTVLASSDDDTLSSDGSGSFISGDGSSDGNGNFQSDDDSESVLDDGNGMDSEDTPSYDKEEIISLKKHATS